MRLRYYVATLGIAAGAVLAIAPGAQAAVTENVSVPFNLSLTLPCNFDTVALTGTVHTLASFTFSNDNSHFSADMLFNHQGVSGTDLTTGAKYQATGGSHDQISNNLVNGQEQISVRDNFQLIGQGSAPNVAFDEEGHLTINANGDFTVDFGPPFNISCR